MDALERGVSLAGEIEERLELSYNRHGLLYEVLALGYGENLATIFTMAEKNKLLKLRDADKAAMKKMFDRFLDAVGNAGKGEQK